jgi:hypothetical protein
MVFSRYSTNKTDHHNIDIPQKPGSDHVGSWEMLFICVASLITNVNKENEDNEHNMTKVRVDPGGGSNFSQKLDLKLGVVVVAIAW